MHDDGTRELVTAPRAATPDEATLEVSAAQQTFGLGGDEPEQRAALVLDALDEGRQVLGTPRQDTLLTRYG